MNARAKAADLVERFTGRPPTNERRCKLSTDRTLALLGRVAEIVYESDKGDGPRLYRHEFDRWPLLTADPEGKELRIHGAGMRIRAEGITG